MDIKTAITQNSVWKFDMVLKRYVRFPRNEDPVSDNIPYTAEWEPFDSLERFGDSIIVYRPVPFGQGQMRRTSDVEYDDLEDRDFTSTDKDAD